MRRLLSASLAASVVLLAACGSTDSTDTASDSGATTSSVVRATTDATTSTTPSTSSPDDHTTDGHPTDDHATDDHHSTDEPAMALAYVADGYLDPTKIDLSGVEGVTAEETTAAEDLLRRTVEVVPEKWPTLDDALAAGFVPDGTPPNGAQHVFNWAWIDDGREFDANYPESLVYMENPYTGAWELVNAMYLLEDGATIENETSPFGDLAQLHSHPNFCWELDAANNTGRIIPSFATGRATCTPPATNVDTAMVHVWVRPNPCGAFAELTGVQAGTTQSGTNNCNPIHGHGTADGEVPDGESYGGVDTCLREQGVDLGVIGDPASAAGGNPGETAPPTPEMLDALTICGATSTEGIFVNPATGTI
jgi:hypothetical protein